MSWTSFSSTRIFSPGANASGARRLPKHAATSSSSARRATTTTPSSTGSSQVSPPPPSCACCPDPAPALPCGCIGRQPVQCVFTAPGAVQWPLRWGNLGASRGWSRLARAPRPCTPTISYLLWGIRAWAASLWSLRRLHGAGTSASASASASAYGPLSRVFHDPTACCDLTLRGPPRLRDLLIGACNPICHSCVYV